MMTAARERPWRLVTLVRWAAWGVALAATGLLLQASAIRTDPLAGLAVEADLVYRAGPGGERRLDLYRPDGPAPPGGWPVVVAIHGGGWRGGDKGEFGRSLAALARLGVAVASVDYTLSAPGRPSWPANLEDVRESVRWVRHHAAEYDLDARRVAALGASAGGHLAALLGTATDDPKARIAAVVDLYGPSDLAALGGPAASPTGPVALMLGGPTEALPGTAFAASPTRRVTADSAPFLLIHGREDRLVPAEQSERLASALESAGVRHRLIILDGAAHGFGLEAAGRDLVPEILAFLNESWKH